MRVCVFLWTGFHSNISQWVEWLTTNQLSWNKTFTYPPEENFSEVMEIFLFYLFFDQVQEE